jgi:PAS domain S-box-containing protein
MDHQALNALSRRARLSTRKPAKRRSRGTKVATSSGANSGASRQLQRLFELASAVDRAESLDEIYASALNILLKSIPVDRAAILLFDEAKVMRFRASRGISEGYRQAVEGHSPWAVDDPRPSPVTIPDVAQSEVDPGLKQVILQEGIAACAFIPLKHQGKLLGKFMLYFDEPHRFDRKELDLAGLIATQVAFAIERKRTSDASRLYKEVFAHSTEGVAILDPTGIYLEQNDAHRALLGYSDEDLLGQTPSLHMGESLFADIVRELRVSGQCRREIITRKKDGRLLAIELSAFAVRHKNGEPACYVGIKRDISDRQKSEFELREARERLGLALSAASMVAWEWDQVSNAIHCSSGAVELFGFASGKLPDLARLVDARDWPNVLGALAEAIKGSGPFEIEHRLTPPRGETRWMTTRGALAQTARGDAPRILAVSMDITNRKRVESDLENAKEQLARYTRELEARVAERTAELEESNRSLESFSYSVAHDLKAPLRALRMYSKLLRDEFSPELGSGGVDFTMRIESAAQKMNHLIEDLLGYSRLSHEEFPSHEFPLENLVKVVLLQMAEDIQARKAIIELAAFRFNVLANETVLEQVVGNLLSNAIKFVEPSVNAQVRISACEVGSFVRLAVRDNGIGIHPEHTERIFRVFERLHGSSEYPGTGIGLAIVKKGIERMGGRVGVESHFGKGSCFWVDIPKGSHLRS